MSLQTFQETLVTQQAAGTLFNTYTAAKSVINAQALYTAQPNWWYIGRKVRVSIAGALSNIVTTPGTVTFQFVVGGVAVFTTGPIQLNATAHVLLPFTLDIILTCRSVGAGVTATLEGQGRLNGIHFTLTAGQVDAPNTPGTFMVPATTPAVGAGFDSTLATIFDFFVGFSISNIGNGVQVQDYSVEALN